MGWALVLLLLILTTSLAVLALRRRQAHTTATGRTARRATSPVPTESAFKAVSIRPGKGACAPAKALAGARYLQSAAPVFPVPGCTAATCNCHYSYHADRRSDEDRRAPYSIRTEMFGSTGQSDRRTARRDRRKG